MKREELTSDGVARAIVRIQQAAQGSARGRFVTCLQELIDLQERLARGETPDPDSYPEGLAALDFAVQLERSSLSTPAAEGLRARTDPETLRRIARHQQELKAEEMEDRRQDEHTADAASNDTTRFQFQMREFGKRIRLQHCKKPVRSAESRINSDWSVRTDHEAKVPEVICEVHLRLLVSDTSSLPLPAEFRYRPSDPYAIEARFHTGADELVTWVFARETVAAGLRTHAGAGDVKIWPRNDSRAKKTICISLGSPEGMAVLEAPRNALQTFLRRTNDLVPPGTEGQHFDIDASFDLTTFQAKGNQSRTRTDQ